MWITAYSGKDEYPNSYTPKTNPLEGKLWDITEFTSEEVSSIIKSPEKDELHHKFTQLSDTDDVITFFNKILALYEGGQITEEEFDNFHTRVKDRKDYEEIISNFQ